MFLVYLLLRFSRTNLGRDPGCNESVFEGYISNEDKIVQDMRYQVEINSEQEQARIAAE